VFRKLKIFSIRRLSFLLFVVVFRLVPRNFSSFNCFLHCFKEHDHEWSCLSNHSLLTISCDLVSRPLPDKLQRIMIAHFSWVKDLFQHPLLQFCFIQSTCFCLLSPIVSLTVCMFQRTAPYFLFHCWYQGFGVFQSFPTKTRFLRF
jgi:hypothetical protein